MKLVDTLKDQADSGKCFVAFAQSEENQINVWLADAISANVDDGFVMAPFSGDAIGIRRSDAQISTCEIAKATSAKGLSLDPHGHGDFVDLVKRGVDAIAEGNFAKVVLSREEIHEVEIDVYSSFVRLLSEYPTAFRYLWYAPQTGFWMGASPEVLLKADADSFRTMALAGTQLFGPHLFWPEKEREEQFFVTQFITESLRPFVEKLEVSEPYTAQAGRLAHIKTDISGRLNESSTWTDVVSVLHPTPAVCGYPKPDALEFILREEGYDRSFYSGYLGEVSAKKIDLYVNLRCMRYDGALSLFVGCGITAASNPEREYLETVNKSMTIKKILS